MQLLDLYPRAWRERYGDELVALLAVRPPSLRDRVDIVRGAVDAHVHPQLARAALRDRRVFAPFAGLVLLALVVLVMANSPERSDEFGTYRDGWLAAPFWWAAFGMLGVGLAAAFDRLPNGARVGRSAAVIAVVGGLPFGLVPWALPFAAIMLAALAVLALAGLRAGWPRVTSLGMAVLALLAAAVIGWLVTQPWYLMRLDPGAGVVALLCLASQWPLLGLILLRTPRSSVAPMVAAPAEMPA